MALLSVVVLGTTGYAWGTLRSLNAGLEGSDVIHNELAAPDGATDILLVGNDSRTDAQGNPLPEEVLRKLRASDAGGNLTDTMILVRIPNGGERASAVSFPRDTRVDMGRFGTHKLNSALARAEAAARERLREQGVTGQELAKRARAAGQRFLIETINELAGVTIDHYAEVNLLGFYRLTKVIGGVKVCLKNPVDDSEYSGAVFPAGPQVISGADALAFVRQRHGLPDGDLDRIVRQQAFLASMADKILSAGVLGNPAKLAKLVGALKDSITLGEDWNVLSFARKMQGLAAGNIKFYTIPVHFEDGDLVTNPEKVERFVDSLLLPPEKREAEQQEQERKAQLRAETTVDVYNAAGVDGMAGRVRQNLVEEGFDQGVSANAERMMQRSVVRYAPGDKQAARLVAEELGGLPIESSEEVEQGSVSVFLGENYSGPGAREFTGEQQVQLDGAQDGDSGSAPVSGKDQRDGPITAAGGVPCVD